MNLALEQELSKIKRYRHMNVALEKEVSLQKKSLNLKHIKFEFKWKNPPNTEIDADISALVCKSITDDKDESRSVLINENYFVFYGKKVSPDDAVNVHIDSVEVEEKNNSDFSVQTLWVDLDKINPLATEVVLIASIYDSEIRKQNFSMIKEGFLKVINAQTDTELANFPFGQGDFSTEITLHVGSIYVSQINDGVRQWDFESFGQGSANIDLSEILKSYGAEVGS